MEFKPGLWLRYHLAQAVPLFPVPGLPKRRAAQAVRAK